MSSLLLAIALIVPAAGDPIASKSLVVVQPEVQIDRWKELRPMVADPTLPLLRNALEQCKQQLAAQQAAERTGENAADGDSSKSKVVQALESRIKRLERVIAEREKAIEEHKNGPPPKPSVMLIPPAEIPNRGQWRIIPLEH